MTDEEKEFYEKADELYERQEDEKCQRLSEEWSRHSGLYP